MSDSDKSPPVFSLSWPTRKSRRIKLTILYILVGMSFLSLLEWNPWVNHDSDIADLPSVSEEMEWTSIIDMPWTEVPDLRSDEVNFTSSPFRVEECNSRWAWLEPPTNTKIDVVTSNGEAITILYGNSDDVRLSYPWENSALLCDKEIQNASVILHKDGEIYHVVSMGVLGEEARTQIPYGWINWAFLGIISGYLLLKAMPSAARARNSRIRKMTLGWNGHSDDDWVIYDPLELIGSNPQMKKFKDGSVISEHPSKLHPVLVATATPWIVVLAFTLLCFDLILVDIFSTDGLALGGMLNNDFEFDFLGFCLAVFIITIGPWVLIGKLMHTKENMMSTFGAFIQKRRLQALIDDVPTSTVRGAAVGRVEMAGVALSTSTGEYGHHIAGKMDERVLGIRNPDNWPGFRWLAKTERETWDSEHLFEFILHDGTSGIKVSMPRKKYVFGHPTSNLTNGIFYRHTHWSIDEGDPVFVIGEVKIGKDGEVYIGVDEDSGLPSAVFKGTEWTVVGKYRSIFEYICADILGLLILIRIGLFIGGII